MSDEYKNVRRIQSLSRANLTNELKVKMLGFDADSKALGFKDSAGTMHYYNEEGGDAIFNSMELNSTLTLNGFGGNTGSLGVNSDGELVIVATPDATETGYTSTGIIDFDGITATIGGTTFNIGASKCYFVDNTTDPTTPVITYKLFDTVSGITLTNISTSITTFIGIDIDGNIIQQTEPFTPTQYRDIIPLGNVVHSNKTTVNAINNAPATILSPVNKMMDLTYAIGVFNIDGNDITAGGANLTIQKSEGEIYKNGSNFSNDHKDPDTLLLGQLSAPATLRYRTQTGTETTDRTTIIPGYYDLNGVVTSISSKWTIQRIFIFPSNAIRIQYGQTYYSTKAQAMAAINTESFVKEDNIKNNGILRALLVIASNCTDLTNTNQAEFVKVGKFETNIGGNTATTTLQQAYTNSGEEPEITIDQDAISIKNATASDTNDILNFFNIAGTQTAGIRGNGSFISEGYVDINKSYSYTKAGYQWTNEYNGNESTYYSYNESTRVYTFNSGGTSVYWINGVRYTAPSNTNTVTHTTTAGMHYIYIDSSNNLVTSTTVWDLSQSIVPLLAVYWTGSVGIPIYELHNKTRNRDWHANAHTSLGTQAEIAGFTLSNINNGDTSPTTAKLKYGIAEGYLKDEDIKLTLGILASGGSSYNILYRGTASSTALTITSASMPFSVGATYIAYNNVTLGTLVQASTAKWVNYFVVAIPTKNSNSGTITGQTTTHNYRYVFVPGQAEHSSLASAQAEEFWSLNMGDLANFPEWVPLYRITYRTNSSYTNATGRVMVEEYKRYYIARASLTGTGSTTTAHNALIGRDATAAHPITAITGTADYLAAFDSSGNGTSLIKSTFALASHNQSWSTITSTPTTLAGYGITDATPSSHIGSTGSAHGNATVSVAGFMSSADKTKLDGIATGANLYVHPNHSGDVTSVGDGATTIASNVVTNAKLAQVDTQTFKGRNTASTGNVEDLTVATVKTMLNLSGVNSGDQTITLTGDVTGSGTGSFATTLATISQSTGSNFVKISLDTKGRVTGNTAISASDINGLFSATTANYIYASPNGSSGTPSFRALVANDIPSLSGIYALTSHTHAYTALTGGTVGQIPFATSNTAFSSSSNLFWDNTNGYLGINTSSPAYPLDVAGIASCSTYFRTNKSSDTAYSSTSVPSTSQITYYSYNGSYTSGVTRCLLSYYRLHCENPPSSADTDQNYAWNGVVGGSTEYNPKFIWGAKVSSSSEELMRLDANAGMPRLGIGTSSPAYTLDVAGVMTTDNYLRVNKSSSTAYTSSSSSAPPVYGTYLRNDNTTLGFPNRYILDRKIALALDQDSLYDFMWDGLVTDVLYSPKYIWGARTASSTYKELMRLDANAGSPMLGIGTTAPAYTLDVNGDVRSTGMVTINSAFGLLLSGAGAPAENGGFAHDTTQKAFVGYANGQKGWMPRQIYKMYGSTTVTGTSQTNVLTGSAKGSISLPAGSFSTNGKSFRVKCGGTVSRGSSGAFSFQFWYGGQDFGYVGSDTSTVSGDWELEATFMVGSTVVSNVRLTFAAGFTGGDATTTRLDFKSQNTSSVASSLILLGASSHASNSITTYYAIIEEC